MALQNRIAVLQHMGEHERALALQVALADESAEGHYQRGLAAVKAGRYEECVEAIERCLAEQPEHAHALWTVACAHSLLGERERALEALARAVGVDPGLGTEIAADPDFEVLREVPRFWELVRG